MRRQLKLAYGFRWMLQKTTKNILWYGWMFMSVTLESAVFMWKKLLRHVAFHQEYKRSHTQTNVRHICEISLRTTWDLWSENNWFRIFFMEVFVFDWWTSLQSSAHEGLRLSIFCIFWVRYTRTLIKRCMGTKIGVVQNISGIQKLGQNWQRANGIRVEYFPRIQYFVVQSRSSRFLGSGSEKKWYSISDDSPQNELDQMVEKMVLTFVKSGHPVFRVTSPLSRSGQKQRRWKIVDTLLCRFWNDKNCFSNNCFCKSAQSLRDRCRNVWRIWNSFMIERRHPLWEDSQVPHSCQAWSRQTCLWIKMIMLTKIFYSRNTDKKNWANFVWTQESWMLLKSDSISWRKTLQKSHNSTVAKACREYSLPRDKETSETKGWIRGNTKIGSVLEITIWCLQVIYGVEIRIMSLSDDNSHSWSEFLMTWTNWSRILTTSSEPQKRGSKNFR